MGDEVREVRSQVDASDEETLLLSTSSSPEKTPDNDTDHTDEFRVSRVSSESSSDDELFVVVDEEPSSSSFSFSASSSSSSS